MSIRSIFFSVFKGGQRLLSLLLIALVYLYRFTLSPVLHLIAPGSGCRFQPTCSQYALEAVQMHGPFKGSYLAVRRIARCHPWGGHGWDPVPCKKHPHSHPSTFSHDSIRTITKF